jgi:HAD superfamily hydrolase (TIGR01509 family)
MAAGLQVVSIAYFALAPGLPDAVAGTDAKDARWMPVSEARDLAFDHDRIVRDALERVRAKLEYTTLALHFVEDPFTLPGASTLIDRLRDAGIRVAVATSAPALNVEHTLREIGLADRLDAIARGDQVPQGKPAPDVFLYAARLLGVPPSACLAFEDAPIGVAAAKAAGMRCIAITSRFAADVFGASEPPPDWTGADVDAYLTAARF